MRKVFLGLGIVGIVVGVIMSAPPVLTEGRLSLLGLLFIFASSIILIITKVSAR